MSTNGPPHKGKDVLVTISGHALEDEVDDICRAIQRMRGVSQIFNRLDRHRSPEHVPALQGAVGPKRWPRFAFMEAHWSPTARMAAALMGAAALLYGLSQRTVGATTLAASGLGLLRQSAANQEFRGTAGLPRRVCKHRSEVMNLLIRASSLSALLARRTKKVGGIIHNQLFTEVVQ